jgi:hypothetical protein
VLVFVRELIAQVHRAVRGAAHARDFHGADPPAAVRALTALTSDMGVSFYASVRALVGAGPHCPSQRTVDSTPDVPVCTSGIKLRTTQYPNTM